jgi:ABC-type Fe3+-siderophore transport system permease subunit
VEGNKEIQENYILGITAGAMLIFAIALFMFIVLMCIKCAGPKRVGFLAGRLNHPDYDPTNKDVNGFDAKKDKEFTRKVGVVRLMFVISGLAVVVCVVLFYTHGMAAFRLSLDDINQGLQLIDETATDATGVLNSAKVNTDNLVSEFNGMKTGTDGQICKGDSDMASGIRDEIGKVDGVINEFKVPFDKNVDTVIEGLNMITNTTQDVASYVDKVRRD